MADRMVLAGDIAVAIVGPEKGVEAVQEMILEGAALREVNSRLLYEIEVLRRDRDALSAEKAAMEIKNAVLKVKNAELRLGMAPKTAENAPKPAENGRDEENRPSAPASDALLPLKMTVAALGDRVFALERRAVRPDFRFDLIK